MKIGSSVNPKRRFAEMCNQKNPAITVGTQRKYELIFESRIVERKIENELHEKYANKRVTGEWFSLSVEDIKNVRKTYDERTENENENENRDVNKEVIKDDIQDIRFSEFWQIYPKKVGKADARKSWLKIKPTEELHEQIINKVSAYKQRDLWGEQKAKQKEKEEKTLSLNIHVNGLGEKLQQVIKYKDEPKSYFDQFDAVICDEAHSLPSQSTRGIFEKLSNCPIRIGLTGTLDGMKTNKMVIEGLTGKVYKVISTKELMDKDLLTLLSIECILLKHPDAIRKQCKGCSYQEELNYLVSSISRNAFISKLSTKLKGNTLVLFQYVEKHGKILEKNISSLLAGTDRQVLYVSGEVDMETRENIRQLVEKEKDCVIVASYQCYQAGINIKNLHNIILASPSKSRIRILQSIGRQLRKSQNKSVAKLYDISDDLSWKSYKNFTLKHFLERIKIYNDEQFSYNINTLNL